MNIFNRVKFSTPENVELELTLAGIGNRAWALLIDYLVLGLIILLCVIIGLIISLVFIDFWTSVFGDRAPLWLFGIAIFTNYIIYSGYFVFFETIWQGQTPGKRFTKIRVIRDDGRPVRLTQIALRSLLRPIDEFLFIGAILIMFNPWEKRLGDWAAGTIVIQNQAPNSPQNSSQNSSQNLSISKSGENFAAELLQKADFSDLLPDEFTVIKEYLQRRHQLSLKGKADTSSRLAKDVKEIINFTEIPANISADEFLEAVYLAYQQQSF